MNTNTTDEYHYCYVLKTTLKGWQEQSNYSHTVLYPRVQWLGMHHKKRRILDVWSSHLAYQKLRSLKWDRIAREKGVENHLKWAMRRWKEGATDKAVLVEKRKMKVLYFLGFFRQIYSLKKYL